VPGNVDQLEPLVARGAMGFKAFMCPSGIDEFPACDERTLREGMQRIADLDSILLVHAEDPELLREPGGPGPYDFVESRPPEAEISAISRVVELASATGCRVHVVHVSTARGAALLGEDVSGETCPHYMLYTAADMVRIGGTAKCAPPFRDQRMPLMSIVVSDHSPSSLELKESDDFRKIWGGISSCQSTRQLLLGQDVDVLTVATVTSTDIAHRFRIPNKGDIAPGYDADLWLVDLDHEDVVRREELLYKNQFSAHEGQKIRGRTLQTIHGAPKFIRPGASRE
jgi:allantoinase